MMRVRFAPSPTGPLHIGGVRTALYNYLWAKKNNGVFILRIEDTDQKRYVPQAEQYILDSLKWLGLEPDEGPHQGGAYGPYRQSERKKIYQEQVKNLLNNGTAYLAFDTPEALEAMRASEKKKGVHTPKYDHSVRLQMRNALTMTDQEINQALTNKEPYVIRLKVTPNQTITVVDHIRGDVRFDSTELDDKILIKSDGMPTYHLANIVDDHLMKITHVIRGEEWLPSTAHHVLLYRAFGWEATMPVFAHLPLILKPTGKGKLSKRDGRKLGIPVFPLSWQGHTPDESFKGFKSYGFLPDAVINFLAFLGWNPGTDQEIMSRTTLISLFDTKQIAKSGARFDYEKAKWFNQQYIASLMDSELAGELKKVLKSHHIHATDDQLSDIADMMKDRLETLEDILPKGQFFFHTPKEYNAKQVRKRWKTNSADLLKSFVGVLADIRFVSPIALETAIKDWMQNHQINFGQLLPLIRLALCGDLQGPDLFRIIFYLGKNESIKRLENALSAFPQYQHQ